MEAVRLSSDSLWCRAQSRSSSQLPEGQKVNWWVLPTSVESPDPCETSQSGRWAKQSGDPTEMLMGSPTLGLRREGHCNTDSNSALWHREQNVSHLEDLTFVCSLCPWDKTTCATLFPNKTKFADCTVQNKPGHQDQSHLKASVLQTFF